jgi:hypothetical protein
MERKAKPDNFIEPMPKKQFRSLVRHFQDIGGVVLMGEEYDAYLQKHGAEALTLNGYTIMYHQKPGRAAVYEELIHAEQFRNNKNDGSPESILKNEIEAQEKLLKMSKLYGLTEPEILQTNEALKKYKSKLELLKRGGL